MKNKQLKTWFYDIGALCVLIGLFFVFYLGTRALSVPDEARYGEIPREMLALHDFITPHLNGIKYFEKPTWVYWVGALSIKCFGLNAWALRLPTMLMGLLAAIALYAAGRQLFDRRSGFLAALMLATSFLYFAMAHSLTLDMTLSSWLTISLLSFIVAVDLPVGSSARRNLCWLMFATAALALMTKGLIGIVFPGAIVFLWLLCTHRWRELTALHWLTGLVLFLIIAAPWHVLVQQQNPEFFHFYFIEQHFTRYFTKAMHRYQPWWWFFPVLIGGLLPWTFFLPSALKMSFTKVPKALRDKNYFLILWAVFIFTFFSLSDSKLIPYLIPVLPPLVLLIARYFSVMWLERNRALQTSACATGLLLALMTLALMLAPRLDKHLSPLAIDALKMLAWLTGLWSLALLAWCFKGKTARSLLVVLGVGSGIFCWGLVLAVPALDTRPIKHLALDVNALAKPNDWIVSYGTYYQDLPFYTQRHVIIVNWRNELSFGLAHQPEARGWLMDADVFWSKVTTSPETIYMIVDARLYQQLALTHPMTLLDQSNSDVLVKIH